MTFTRKIADYAQLAKLRLSLSVVFSAGMAYLIASPPPTDWLTLVFILVGGLLVTASANAINEIWEVTHDAKMRRTASRPLPAGRMRRAEAVAFAALAGLGGVALLYFGANPLTGALGALSVVLYGFVYTPMKRVSPLAVVVGAVPGAMPVVIGWAAAGHGLSQGAWVLFLIQFFWQLPHFYAIAWVAYDDYARAGFNLMPSGGQRNRWSAIQIVAYTSCLIPISFLPWYFGVSGPVGLSVMLGASALFLAQTMWLYFKQSRKAALYIMFGSFLYLPLVLIALLLDKV